MRKPLPGLPEVVKAFPVDGVLREVAEQLTDKARQDYRPQAQDEKVGREGENAASFAYPPQVPVGNEDHYGHADGDVVGKQGREGRYQSVGAGRRLHGYGHGVIDQQCDSRDLGDDGPEILSCNDVRTAGPRIDHHHLAVRERDEEQHEQQGERDRYNQREGGQADVGHQLDEHLLGPVGRR